MRSPLALYQRRMRSEEIAPAAEVDDSSTVKVGQRFAEGRLAVVARVVVEPPPARRSAP